MYLRGKKNTDNFWATRGKRGEDISEEAVDEEVVEAMEAALEGWTRDMEDIDNSTIHE